MRPALFMNRLMCVQEYQKSFELQIKGTEFQFRKDVEANTKNVNKELSLNQV